MAFYSLKDWVTKAYGQAALKKEKITKGGPQEKWLKKPWRVLKVDVCGIGSSG